jgi:UDP:flavonoid glycosyltransferase YjiC (YdhE family)
VITHGGHGTLMKALAAGVPVLVLPMGRDQLDNAARLTARGAGLRLRPSAKPGDIAAAVRTLLQDPTHGEAAKRMSRRLRSETERDRAVEELEGLPVALAAGAA